MLSISKENYHWTDHVRMKMRQYRLTEGRVKRVLRHPKRLEVGVAEDTVAGMQPAGSPKHPFEIWVMWTEKKRDKNLPHPRKGAWPPRGFTPNPLLKKERGQNKCKFTFGNQVIIISAWRYPGMSPLREPPPIPDDVWEALRKIRK